jgi:transposase
VLQYHFSWKTLSAMAGITWRNFHFRLFSGAIKGPQIVEFLELLLRHLPGKLLVIWDGLPGHRSGLVKDFVAGQQGRLELERLPAYAPELNPVEYLWGHLKHHELPNFCPKNPSELSHHTIRALRRLRRPTPLKFKPAIPATIIVFLCLHLMTRDSDGGCCDSLSIMTLSCRIGNLGILAELQDRGAKRD